MKYPVTGISKRAEFSTVGGRSAVAFYSPSERQFLWQTVEFPSPCKIPLLLSNEQTGDENNRGVGTI